MTHGMLAEVPLPILLSALAALAVASGAVAIGAWRALRRERRAKLRDQSPDFP